MNILSEYNASFFTLLLGSELRNIPAPVTHIIEMFRKFG